MPTTFFILAGEASGDTHAAKLITELKKLDPSARFVGMGGPKMAAAGLEVAKDLEGMQVVGFWEVAKQYGFFKRVFYQLLDRLKQECPSALICVDYPGFNLRFAREVRKLGIPVLYYIVPQVWAWKALRAKKMAQFVDRAFCVFEFEPPFFEKFGLKTTFVGHPLIDDAGYRIQDAGLKLPPGPKTVALLPGSRRNEFEALYGVSCEGIRIAREKGLNIRALVSVIEGVPAGYDIGIRHLMDNTLSEGEDLYDYLTRHKINPEDPKLAETSRRHVLVDPDANDLPATTAPHSRLLPSLADFSVVKSGTSTLEAGLAGKPMCVVYKAGTISYAIAHLVVNIPVFSLVNIVLGRYAVPELLQSEVNPARIAQEIERGLTDEKYREQQKAALAELPKKLGGPGASARAAKGIVDFLKGRA